MGKKIVSGGGGGTINKTLIARDALLDAIIARDIPPAGSFTIYDLMKRSDGRLTLGAAAGRCERMRREGKLEAARFGRVKYYWPTRKKT